MSHPFRLVLAALFVAPFLVACPTPQSGEGEGEGSSGSEGEGTPAGEGEGTHGGEGEGTHGGEGEGSAGEGEGSAGEGEGSAGEGEGSAGEGEGEGSVGEGEGGAGEGEGEGEPGACLVPKVAQVGSNSGDTTTGTAELVGSNAEGCLADPTGLEEVWTFTPPSDGELVVTVTPTNNASDLGFYVRTACADEATNLVDKSAANDCIDNAGAGAAETDTFELTAATPLIIVVDTFVDPQNGANPGAYTLDIAFTAPTCGNGVKEGAEQCDKNDFGGASCNDFAPATLGTLSCNNNCTANTTQCVSVCTGAQTATVSTTLSGDTTSGTGVLSQSCSPQADTAANENIWSFTPATTGEFVAKMTSATDQLVFVRTTCNDQATEIACADAQGAGTVEVAPFSATAGVPVTIVVKAFQQQGDEGPYTLEIDPLPEVEPNDTPPATADTFAAGFTGFVSSATDKDCVSVHADAQQSITATVGDGGDNRCTQGELDSFVEIFDTNGTTSLGSNDDIDNQNGNLCSQVTTTSPVSAAGTYFVCVSQSPNPAAFGAAPFLYTLDVTAQ